MSAARLAEIRKAVIAVVAAVGEAASLGLLPDPWSKYAAVVLAAAASYGVFKVPNAAVANRAAQ